MANEKLGLPSKQRKALLRNQVTNLLWYGKIETTLDRAKSVQRETEKLLTIAIKAYEDTVKVTKTIKDEKGVKAEHEIVNDGPKKLAARRAIMAYVYDIQEKRQPKEAKATFKARTVDIKHPLMEKIFNVYAPKYDARAKELGIGGGYTRIIKLDNRRGDNAQRAIIELI